MLNNKTNDNTELLYQLVKGFPKYKETKSHVVPSMTFTPDFPKGESKPFVPLEIKKLEGYNAFKK